ncbi:glycosyltransferase [Christiangramia portivictoriae]|uniref:glycosyltransferase n=1 Tax=Christiangramia portivictoriae TaxID=326069 RepID=UPI000408DB78|nr:glycosyltransferase [Christiangramia portivictoriae]
MKDLDSSVGSAETGFSIIIPFRNEQFHLPALFDSLEHLKYPRNKFEILMINDSSEDESEKLVQEFGEMHPELSIDLLQNQRASISAKKDAIKVGIEHSRFEYIVTTDADCKVPEFWLQGFDTYIKTDNSDLIAAPVILDEVHPEAPLYRKFDLIDLMSLQATTIGAFGLGRPFICNAANLCFNKNSFQEIGGYKQSSNYAGGDDVFLLQQFKENERKIDFIRSTSMIVTTAAQKDLGSFIQQRLRWAAKSAGYKNHFARFVALTVFLMNAAIIIGLVLCLFNPSYLQWLMIAFLVKFNLDFMLIYQAAVFFNRKASMRSYAWSSIAYPFFASGIALTSLFVGFKWKGRDYRK